MLSSFRVCCFGSWSYPMHAIIVILNFKIVSRFLWTCDFINFYFESHLNNVSLKFGIWLLGQSLGDGLDAGVGQAE